MASKCDFKLRGKHSPTDLKNQWCFPPHKRASGCLQSILITSPCTCADEMIALRAVLASLVGAALVGALDTATTTRRSAASFPLALQLESAFFD